MSEKFDLEEAQVVFVLKVLQAIEAALAHPLPRPTMEHPWSDEKEAEMSKRFGDGWPNLRHLLAKGRVSPEPATVSLDAIFSVGERFGSSSTEVEELARYIARGCVSFRFELGPTIDFDLVKESLLGFFSGRTIEHKRLCFYGAVWLKSLGKEISGDLHYAGGIADVFSKDRSIAIECGYTQARKALEAVKNGTTLAVIPYCTNDVVFLFSPGPNVQQLIDETSPSFKNTPKTRST